jgi:hypothetical protein
MCCSRMGVVCSSIELNCAVFGQSNFVVWFLAGSCQVDPLIGNRVQRVACPGAACDDDCAERLSIRLQSNMGGVANQTA